jgi:hypothetical protein
MAPDGKRIGYPESAIRCVANWRACRSRRIAEFGQGLRATDAAHAA